MLAKVHSKRIEGPFRAREELANEDSAEARCGITLAFVDIVRRMQKGRQKKTSPSLGSVHQNGKKWRRHGHVGGLQISGTVNKRAS